MREGIMDEAQRTEKKRLLDDAIKRERTAALIVNTHSRKGRRYFFAATDELARRGISVISSYPVRYPERLPEIVQEAMEKGHKLIIVGGGDGTISSVVDYFAYRDVVFGILPLGTVNSFARTLGIPLDLKGAVGVIAGGKVVDVDLGKIGQDYFSNIIAVGFAAAIARSIPHGLKKYTGVLAYGLMGIKVLLSHRSFECTLDMDGYTVCVNTHQVVIANGGHFGITPLAPDISADDRELMVFVMNTKSRWRMLKLWAAFLLRKPGAFAEAEFYRTGEVWLKATPAQYVEVDGEITAQTPVHVSLAPQALKIMAPLSFNDR